MARHYRFFVESLGAQTAPLPPDQAHHALHVLRLKAGAAVELTDGAGHLAIGALEPGGHGAAVVRIAERLPAGAQQEPVVELAFAVPKGKRLDWLLEKATELGAASLQPVIFQRSVAAPELSEHARRRWRGVCIAAARQCLADFLPRISPPLPLAEYAAGCRADARIVGAPDGPPGLPASLAAWSAGKTVAILIGPEGGLSPAEEAQVRSAGFAPVRLGNLLLRIETAAIALLAGVKLLCRA